MAKTLTNRISGSPLSGVPAKGRLLVCLEYVLLVFCLGVICLRAICTESPPVQSGSLPVNIGENLYSISVSGCLLAAFVIWLVCRLYGKNFIYRITGLEIGLCVFSAAAIISGLAASDKRMAITNIVVLISPLLSAILMVQILDTRAKVKLVLTVIASLGALSAYQGLEQYFTTNQATIEQYQENPQSLLNQFGIEPNSLEQFLFEHRLNSKNVSSFFTTRNSAGSFLLMCFFAVFALLYEKFRSFRNVSSPLLYFLGSLIPAAIILLCLLLTRSKGAIIGLVFALSLFILLLCFGNRLKKHLKLILILVILLVIAVVAFIILYGSKYDSLPGGNSMLVRWQYWKSSAQMYAEHPLAGVGPGNFAYFNQKYKNPAALESVTDPHNFPLSLLAQYGPLGLIGFLLMIFIPLYRGSRLVTCDSVPAAHSSSLTHHPSSIVLRLTAIVLILWVCILLAQRIMIIPAGGIYEMDVLLYIIIRFYIPPVIVFAVSFILLSMLPDAAGHGLKTQDSGLNNQLWCPASLVCGLLGVLLHNMTDYAIFEPGVYAIFWTIIACFIVIRESYLVNRERQYEPRAISSKPLIKAAVIIIALLITWAFFVYALLPVARATTSIKKANQAVSIGLYDTAHSFFSLAAGQDKLSSVAPAMDARLYIMQAQPQQANERPLLTAAQQSLQTAVNRNKADYKNFEKLTGVYTMLSEISTGQEKVDWLNQAFTAASLAVELYPGSGSLNYTFAEIADKLGRNEIALEQYNKAIEIEQQYRGQFNKMYPKVEVISRLGQEKYQIASERIKALKNP
jgi:O-antigen ligase